MVVDLKILFGVITGLAIGWGDILGVFKLETSVGGMNEN